MNKDLSIRATLIELVDIARFCPSARNRQPLRYVVSTDPEKTVQIRDCLLFALDFPGWGDLSRENDPLPTSLWLLWTNVPPLQAMISLLLPGPCCLQLLNADLGNACLVQSKKKSLNPCSHCPNSMRSSSCWLSGTRRNRWYWNRSVAGEQELLAGFCGGSPCPETGAF